jgi:hypothetical protein
MDFDAHGDGEAGPAPTMDKCTSPTPPPLTRPHHQLPIAIEPEEDQR